MKKGILVLCLWNLVTSYDWFLYEGYKLIRITPKTPEQLEYLVDLQEDLTELDFWNEPNRLHKRVTILTPPDVLIDVEHFLEGTGLNYDIIDNDVAMQMAREWDRLGSLEAGLAFNYSDFNDFNTTIAELENMAAMCVPDFICEVKTLGYTYEGRPLNMMKMYKPAPSRPAIWIDSQVHAREWLASATTMNIFRKLITESDTNPEAMFLLNWDFYFLPIVNPDGYHHTWVRDRLWRKNRSPNNGSSCVGTDLNRNFDYNWGERGASDLPCSYIYHGDSPASEYETQAVQNEVAPIADTITAFWTVHTYGQYLLAPLGNCTLPPEWLYISKVTNVTCQAIEKTYGTSWACGNSCEILYRTSGTTSDWAYGTGITYSWTPELRGNGFVVPPSEIEPAYTEMWNGLYAMMREISLKQSGAKSW